eukprot:jgi/Galph1/3704/GphlegSOOS_G2347.1
MLTLCLTTVTVNEIFDKWLVEQVENLSVDVVPSFSDTSNKVSSELSLENSVEAKSSIPLDIRIAYFIQVSSSSLGLFQRLISVLYDPQHLFAVHFDKNCNQTLVKSIEYSIKQTGVSNLFVIPSETLTYSGISLVLNTLSAMTFLLKHKIGEKDWDFFINISGADYPLLSVQNQKKVLEEACNRLETTQSMNFLQMFDEHYSEYRRKLIYIDPSLTLNADANREIEPGEALKPLMVHPYQEYFNFTLYKSEAWMILCRKTVEYLTSESYPRWILASFVNTASAPEHYFATVLKTSPLWQDTIVPFAFRYVRWFHPSLPRQSTQHPFDLDHLSNLVWDDIKESGCFFARKFSTSNSELHNKIDEELLGWNQSLFVKKSSLDQNGYELSLEQVLRAMVESPNHSYKSESFSQDNVSVYIRRSSQVMTGLIQKYINTRKRS